MELKWNEMAIVVALLRLTLRDYPFNQWLKGLANDTQLGWDGVTPLEWDL